MMTDDEFRARVVDEARRMAPAAPPGAFERVLARRAAGARVILPADDVAAPPARPARWGRAAAIAAGVTLVAVGAAAALPGSPVRRWLVQRLSQPAATPAVPQVPSQPMPAAPVTAPDTLVAAVSIPMADSLWVRVDALGDAQLVVQVVDAPTLEVRALAEAAAATFSPRANGVSVSALAGGTLHVDVPADARTFELRVGGAVYARKQGRELRALATADTVGLRLVFGKGGGRR